MGKRLQKFQALVFLFRNIRMKVVSVVRRRLKCLCCSEPFHVCRTTLDTWVLYSLLRSVCIALIMQLFPRPLLMCVWSLLRFTVIEAILKSFTSLSSNFHWHFSLISFFFFPIPLCNLGKWWNTLSPTLSMRCSVGFSKMSPGNSGANKLSHHRN